MEATTLKGICSELKIDPRAHARSYALRSANRKSTRTWRRRTNRVSRGSGRKDQPLRRKPARRSLSKARELKGREGRGGPYSIVCLKNDEYMKDLMCTVFFITITTLPCAH